MKTGTLQDWVTRFDTIDLKNGKMDQSVSHITWWFGKRTPQTDTRWCDMDTLTAYQAISGDNTWGSPDGDTAKIISAADMAYYEGVYGAAADLGMRMNELLIVDNDQSTPYRIRLIWGTGTCTEAIAAYQFTETMFQRYATGERRHSVSLGCPRVGHLNNFWLQIWNSTNDATLDFFIGGHGYMTGWVSL